MGNRSVQAAGESRQQESNTHTQHQTHQHADKDAMIAHTTGRTNSAAVVETRTTIVTTTLGVFVSTLQINNLGHQHYTNISNKYMHT
jgi:hypothetical protein